MRISKGALVIKGKKIRNLYFLCGITIIGRATMSTSLDSGSNLMRLWNLSGPVSGGRGLSCIIDNCLMV